MTTFIYRATVTTETLAETSVRLATNFRNARNHQTSFQHSRVKLDFVNMLDFARHQETISDKREIKWRVLKKFKP